MRFSRQKFTIALLIAMLPLVTALAFLQTPYISDLVLQFALRVTRFRTGARITARTWSVSPYSFSAALEKVSFQYEDLRLDAPELRIQMSPLSLIFGELNMSDIKIVSPRISGKLNPKWLESGSTSKSTKKFYEQDIPKLMGEQLQAADAKLKKSHIYIAKLSLANFSSSLDEFTLADGALEIENLDAGQFRVEWRLNRFKTKALANSIAHFAGSTALIKEGDVYSVTLPLLNLQVDEENLNHLEFSGRWPGDLQTKAHLDLKEVVKWAGDKKWLDEYFYRDAYGVVDAELTATIKENDLKKIEGHVETQNFSFDGYHPNNLTLNIKGSPKDLVISQLHIQLPFVQGDSRSWKNIITAKEIRIANNQLTGELELDRAGHCAILEGADVDECLVTFAATGKLKIAGTLEPVLLKISPDVKIEEGYVTSDPMNIGPIKSPLLSIKTAQMTGSFEVSAKELNFTEMFVDWPDSKVRVTGRIIPKPTSVELNVEGTKIHLEKMLNHFLDLAVQGTTTVSTKITYSKLIPKDQGKTKVINKVQIQDIGVEGQNFGLALGDVVYAGNQLKIGPLKLISGGGKATIEGLLNSRVSPSRMTLSAVLDRIELTGVLPDSKKEVFRGFVSGVSHLEGETGVKSKQFLNGPIDLKVETLKAFGIPFQKASVKATYRDRSLWLNTITATKDRSEVNLSGVLNPDGGSEIKFSSNATPIRDLNLHPAFNILQSGKVEIQGWWKPKKGWGVLGEISELRIAGVDFDNGQVALSGDNERLKIDAYSGKNFIFQYQSKDTLTDHHLEKLSGTFKDQGLYAIFAYLKKWTTYVPLQTKGELQVDWLPGSGQISAQSLKISMPSTASGKNEDIVNFEGKKVLAWSENRITKNTFTLTGPLSLESKSPVGAEEWGFVGHIPLSFLDLVVPKFKLSDGALILNGKLSMPPDLSHFEAIGHIDNGTLLIPSLGQPIKDVKSKISFNNQTISFSDTSGSMGSGTIQVSGAYKLDFDKAGLAIQASLNRAHMVVMDDVPLDLNGEVALRGEDVPYLISGQVQILNGLYSKEMGKNNTPLEANVPPLLKYALSIDLGSNTYVKNTLANLNVTGRLFLTGDDVDPQMQGTLDLANGSIYANETEFRVTQGSVNFNGAKGGIPTVNLQAAASVKSASNKEYKIELRASGPGNNLDIEFSSDPVLPTPDIVSLLAFGVLRSEDQVNSDASLADAARIEAFQAVFGKVIGSAIDKTTGFQVRFQNSATSTVQRTSPVKGVESVPKVVVVRKLSDKMTATFGRSLDIVNPGTNVQLDYKLLKNMNLSGVWETQENQNSSSGGVDLRFKFDVK